MKVWLSYAEFEGTPLVLLRADANELSEEERYACLYTTYCGPCTELTANCTTNVKSPSLWHLASTRRCCCICRQARADAAARESPEEAPAQREIRARSVYERAFTELRNDQPDAKQEALLLLEAWQAFEASTTSTCAVTWDRVMLYHRTSVAQVHITVRG